MLLEDERGNKYYEITLRRRASGYQGIGMKIIRRSGYQDDTYEIRYYT